MVQDKYVIAGAGAIGCYVGGLLAGAGQEVTLLGRPRVLGEIQGDGLTLTDYAGRSKKLHKTRLHLSDDPHCLSHAGLVLVAVKSDDTGKIARLIARHAPPGAPVVSLQNGLDAAAILRGQLPDRDVRAAMVGFNVVPKGQGRFHQATSGEIVIGTGEGSLGELLAASGLPVRESDQIEAVQWGKLLVNLNNALNALSGLPLKQQLSDRAWRGLMADQMVEAVGVLKVAGIAAQPVTPLPLWLTPHLLRLPTPLFSRIAARMLTIDPDARSSMAYDLRRRRKTEIASLQGEIIQLGKAHRVPTPICKAVAGAIEAAEKTGAPGMTAAQLRALL